MEPNPYKYINPFTDYGFKRIFGEEPNKDLLIDFLNSVLFDELGQITDLKYLCTKFTGYTYSDPRSVLDILCENEKGEKFIVELQKTKFKFFKEKALYFTNLPIWMQAQKNDWNFELKAVFVIAILDFILDENKNDTVNFRYDVKFNHIQTIEIFQDKVTIIYFEMPKFNKQLEELANNYEKWLYVLKNLGKLERFPEKLRTEIFEKLFNVAEIARFTPEQLYFYEESLNAVREMKNVLDTAIEESFEKGTEKGIEKGIKKVAINALNCGLKLEEIVNITGLSIDEIEKLKEK